MKNRIVKFVFLFIFLFFILSIIFNLIIIMLTYVNIMMPPPLVMFISIITAMVQAYYLSGWRVKLENPSGEKIFEF